MEYLSTKNLLRAKIERKTRLNALFVESVLASKCTGMSKRYLVQFNSKARESCITDYGKQGQSTKANRRTWLKGYLVVSEKSGEKGTVDILTCDKENPPARTDDPSMSEFFCEMTWRQY